MAESEQNPIPASEPPIRGEFSIFLFGLFVLGLAVFGLITGQAILVLSSQASQQQVTWTVPAPGGRVVAAGLVCLGIGSLGHWYWTDRRKWPIRVGLLGLALVGVGHLVAWVAAIG